MDIKGMLSSEPSDDASKQLQKPDLQPRLSINNLVNSPPSFASPTTTTTTTSTSTTTVQNHRPSVSSSNNSNNDIRQRNSIINITNDDDVDIRGNITPSMARRYSNSGMNSPILTKTEPPPQAHTTTTTTNSTIQPPPPPVKKISIKEEIENFNKIEESIKLKKTKPIRYKKPPIWSCDWIPIMKRRNAGQASQYMNSAATGTTGSKLETPSISGVEPSHDAEYAVASWIYAILSEIPENEKKYLEIELKFGQIYSKEQDERLQLPVNTETILNLEYFNKNCFFKPGLPADRIEILKKYLEFINKKNRFKFNIAKVHQRDNFFQRHERGSKPIDARITYDIETNRMVDSINKKRVSDLFIYSPSTHFDLRCSISLEIPFDITEDEEKKIGKNVTLIREKLRTSYVHNQTFTKIDLTSIKKFDKEHGSARKTPPSEVYELELELNSHELWQSFNNLRQDSQYYYDLVKTFLANGRVLNKELS